MAGRVIFLATDAVDAHEVLRSADAVVDTADLDALLEGARAGQIVVRRVAALDDEVLAEIAAVAETPTAFSVHPSKAALPLLGKRVLVTRAKEQAQETIRALRRRGAHPVSLPTIDIGPPESSAELDAAVRALPSYDVVAFTSANGVSALFEALARAGLDARAFGTAKVASIGPGTRHALERAGIRADFEPEEHRGEGLARAILATSARRVLLPRAAVAREVLPDTLREAGVHCDVVEAYRTRAPSVESIAESRERLRTLPDAVTFTSSSTVEHFVSLFPDVALEGTIIASIGPITTETCKRLGVRVDVEASPYTIPALLDALERCFSGR